MGSGGSQEAPGEPRPGLRPAGQPAGMESGSGFHRCAARCPQGPPALSVLRFFLKSKSDSCLPCCCLGLGGHRQLCDLLPLPALQFFSHLPPACTTPSPVLVVLPCFLLPVFSVPELPPSSQLVWQQWSWSFWSPGLSSSQAELGAPLCSRSTQGSPQYAVCPRPGPQPWQAAVTPSSLGADRRCAEAEAGGQRGSRGISAFA